MSKKNYGGMTFNECSFMGRIVGAPQFHPYGNGEIVIMHLSTLVREQDANGQWVEHEVVVPLYLSDSSNLVKVVRDYVEDDTQIKVNGYYKNWENDGVQGHGIMVTNLKLGLRARQPQAEGAGGGPSLPA